MFLKCVNKLDRATNEKAQTWCPWLGYCFQHFLCYFLHFLFPFEMFITECNFTFWNTLSFWLSEYVRKYFKKSARSNMEEQEAIAITTGHIYQFREMVLLFYTLLNFLFYPSPPLIQQAPSHPTSSFSVNILSLLQAFFFLSLYSSHEFHTYTTTSFLATFRLCFLYLVSLIWWNFFYPDQILISLIISAVTYLRKIYTQKKLNMNYIIKWVIFLCLNTTKSYTIVLILLVDLTEFCVFIKKKYGVKNKKEWVNTVLGASIVYVYYQGRAVFRCGWQVGISIGHVVSE